MRYPTKTSTKEFCDSIAASIARYEKYRYWASKFASAIAIADPRNRAISEIGFGRRGLLEKGSFQKSPFSRDSREFRDSRDFREPPDCGKQRRIRPFSRDSREFRDFRDSRDSSSEKTPFVMTPSSGPEETIVLRQCNAALRSHGATENRWRLRI